MSYERNMSEKEIVEARDAERDRIADWLENLCDPLSYTPCNACEEGRSFCDHVEAAKAIRNNKHRSEA